MVVKKKTPKAKTVVQKSPATTVVVSPTVNEPSLVVGPTPMLAKVDINVDKPVDDLVEAGLVQKVGRDAKTGRFVSFWYAMKNKATTIIQTVFRRKPYKD